MVLAHKIDEWLAKDEEREKSREEERRQRAQAVVDTWLAKYGLPTLDEVTRKGSDAFTPDQLPAARHIVDVMTNKHCTDPNCPFRDDEVPDFIKK